MNQPNRTAARALVALALVAWAHPAAADAMDDWLAYRQANNLPVDVVASKTGSPAEPTMPAYAGEAANLWVYQRRAMNLPVDPQPSAPGEGVLQPTTPSWLGEASNHWVYYRRSQNLPVEYASAK